MINPTVDYPGLQERLPKDETLGFLSDFFKTIGDPTRLKRLFALSQQDLNVQDISLITVISVSAISHQLAILKLMGLVASRRDGRNMIYRLNDSHVHGIIQLAKDHLSEPRIME